MNRSPIHCVYPFHFERLWHSNIVAQSPNYHTVVRVQIPSDSFITIEAHSQQIFISSPTQELDAMNTRAMNLLIATILCMAISSSSASRFVSVATKLNELADNEFSFSFDREAINNTVADGIVFQVIGAPRHTLMGVKDVNIQFVRVLHRSGAVVPWHVHPRGSENFATIVGHIQVSTMLEGTFNPRRIVSKLPPAHVTSVPQGLPHSVKCISKKDCVYHIFLNNADPGFALTPM